MKKSSEQFSAFHEQKGPNNVQIKSLFHHSQTEEEDFSTPLPLPSGHSMYIERG